MRGEPAYPQPKPTPALLQKREKQAVKATTDKAETAKARKRAGGICETFVRLNVRQNVREKRIWARTDVRCSRRAKETHHLKGGIGRRNRGESILARWKLRVCAECHRLITAHVLVPVNPQADATQIVYWRMR